MYEEKFMRYSLARAKKAASIGEVPVGAVVVQNGQLISSGYNRRESKKKLVNCSADGVCAAVIYT